MVFRKYNNNTRKAGAGENASILSRKVPGVMVMMLVVWNSTKDLFLLPYNSINDIILKVNITTKQALSIQVESK